MQLSNETPTGTYVTDHKGLYAVKEQRSLPATRQQVVLENTAGRTCDHCFGSGRQYYSTKRCSECDGMGNTYPIKIVEAPGMITYEVVGCGIPEPVAA